MAPGFIPNQSLRQRLACTTPLLYIWKCGFGEQDWEEEEWKREGGREGQYKYVLVRAAGDRCSMSHNLLRSLMKCISERSPEELKGGALIQRFVPLLVKGGPLGIDSPSLQGCTLVSANWTPGEEVKAKGAGWGKAISGCTFDTCSKRVPAAAAGVRKGIRRVWNGAEDTIPADRHENKEEDGMPWL